ncbi:MAG: TIGR02678 family protein [Negativicutes bacterium]|nr:TIGR02678 family protein [Negativicutes bacterium]
MDEARQGFKLQDGDELREAIALLLDNYWVVREEQPEWYNLIRRHEPHIRRYFFEKCGWRLIQTPHFYKLEKIPAQPQSWMGITEFQQPRDYALLCCLMAFAEEKGIDEQFLLSDLCESLLALYPHEKEMGGRLNWENYEHRRSLVRALNFATASGMLRLVDGDSDQFAALHTSEALYEVTPLSRYFLRSYPKDLHQYDSLQALQAAEVFDDEAVTGMGRRARIYRQLLLTPAYHASEARPEDFAYLRNMQRRMREELESYTGLYLELYKDCAMLTSQERTGSLSGIFPFHRSGMHAVMLHFAALCRERWQAETWNDQLSAVEFERLLAECRERYQAGWTKECRELPLGKLAAGLLEDLIDWHLAAWDGETALIQLKPALGRLAGRYPEDFAAKLSGGREMAHE